MAKNEFRRLFTYDNKLQKNIINRAKYVPDIDKRVLIFELWSKSD